MPEEFSRTTARKRIMLGSSYVDVPVITKISFKDAADRYQETEYTIDNTGAANRVVHVDDVQGSGASLTVERIDKWTILDPNDRHQETQISMDNVTGGDSVPPHFSTHLKTHVVRYKNPNDADVWIDSELIDQFTVLDPSDRHQETIVTLNQPQTDDAAQADPNDPDISQHGDIGVDPPYRIDPFQNIIDVHVGGAQIFQQVFIFRRFDLGSCQATQAAESGDWFPVDDTWFIEKQIAHEAWPYADIGALINPTGASHANMQQIAFRTKRSELIAAMVSLSHQAGQSPGPSDGFEGPNPWEHWTRITLQPHFACSDLPVPGSGVPTEQPNADNPAHQAAPTFIYYGVLGGYEIDDGHDVPTGTPPFVPPT